MAHIGSFQFPDDTTLIDSKTEFVLGRVRRLITITTVLRRFAGRSEFQDALAGFEAEIERFDCGEVDLSINPGRYLLGRRRRFSLSKDERSCLAVAALEVLTSDRFERSESLHEFSAPITGSPQTFSIPVDGNWPALPRIQINLNQSVNSLTVSGGGKSMTLPLALSAQDIVVLDSEERSALLNSTNALGSVTGDFVELTASGETLTVTSSPAALNGTLSVWWRDRWA
jgi:hypothetical protein